MTTEPKDWVDELIAEFATFLRKDCGFLLDLDQVEHFKKLLRSHIPTPPPVPSSVRELTETIARGAWVNPLPWEQKLTMLSEQLQSFLTAHDQKRDAEEIRRIKHLNRLASWAQQDPTGPWEKYDIQKWVLNEIACALGKQDEPTHWQPESLLKDKKRDAETIRVLEQAKTGLKELLQHGSPVPYGEEGQPVPYESNPEVATSAIEAITLHLQTLKSEV